MRFSGRLVEVVGRRGGAHEMGAPQILASPAFRPRVCGLRSAAWVSLKRTTSGIAPVRALKQEIRYARDDKMRGSWERRMNFPVTVDCWGAGMLFQRQPPSPSNNRFLQATAIVFVRNRKIHSVLVIQRGVGLPLHLPPATNFTFGAHCMNAHAAVHSFA